MNSFYRRALRIIGISPVRAQKEFKIPSIVTYIDQMCVNIAAKIYRDPLHPAVANLPPNSRPGASFKFELPIARAQYQRSFIQKFFHALRDGSLELYMPRSWGVRGCKYNDIVLQPSAHLAIAPAPTPVHAPAIAAPPRHTCVCARCHKVLNTPTVDGRHTPAACARHLAAYLAEHPPQQQ
jgi:hypothetical protein